MGTITNEEFGNRVGVSHSMASRIRSGRRLPGVAVMRRISAEYGIPLAQLMEAHEAGGEAMSRLVRSALLKTAVARAA